MPTKQRRAVAHHPRRGDRHHFIGGVCSIRHLQLAPSRLLLNSAKVLRVHDVPVDPGNENSPAPSRRHPTACRTRCCADSSPARKKETPRPSPRMTAPTTHEGRTTEFGGAFRSSTISSTVTIERFAAITASFCTPTTPHISTLPLRSAFCAWITVTSGRCAGTAASFSPVNGQSMNLTRSDCTSADRFRCSRAARRTEGATPRPHTPPPCRHARVLRPRADSASRFSTASRSRCSDAHARISAPRKDDLRHASRADQLIVDHIGSHADHRQIALLLADDLMPRGERNQVREAFERHHVAVAHRFADRFGKGCNLCQLTILPRAPNPQPLTC